VEEEVSRKGEEEKNGYRQESTSEFLGREKAQGNKEKHSSNESMDIHIMNEKETYDKEAVEEDCEPGSQISSSALTERPVEVLGP